ncbi:MAG TPA: MgtC/SapB family protein [Mycobacteriales bacterium]|jgi:putative Mg2+ transporter-C (MgtC) family protein|nr:MgtC/SapB family protein [Mycobacteriales bacterium]
MAVSETTGVVRLLVTFGLSFSLGFERQLRGSPAGNRTFSLIGLGAAVIGLLSAASAPNALAGAVTGIGFIGAGLVFRQKSGRSEVVRGVTTAAAIFATAAIGAAAGEGQLLVATAATVLVLVSLELPHTPGLRLLDAARYESRFTPDNPPPPPHGEDPARE